MASVVWPPAHAISNAGRLSARGEGGGGCARPPVRRRLLRAAEAPGTAHVTTTNTLATYGHNVKQDLRDLVVRACRRRRQQQQQQQQQQRWQAAGGGGRPVYRFKRKPFFDSSGRYCFLFITWFPLYLSDGLSKNRFSHLTAEKNTEEVDIGSV